MNKAPPLNPKQYETYCADCGLEWPIDPALEVSCPKCSSPVGIPCVWELGSRYKVHLARVERAREMGHLASCFGTNGQIYGRIHYMWIHNPSSNMWDGPSFYGTKCPTGVTYTLVCVEYPGPRLNNPANRFQCMTCDGFWYRWELTDIARCHPLYPYVRPKSQELIAKPEGGILVGETS